MPERVSGDRADLLADVAEMYFIQGKIQSEIAKEVGVTRSMVSRMLTEARQQGIVDIRIRRPVRSNRELAQGLIERYGLHDAFVCDNLYRDRGQLLQILGQAGAQLINKYLKPNLTVGVVWGTTMNAVIDALDYQNMSPIRIVQLSGALGARRNEYDGQALINRMAHKLAGEAFYLHAPLLVEDRNMVDALHATQGIREAIHLAGQADIALLGVGGTDPAFCSYCLTGSITPEQLEGYVKAGAVGVVYSRYFNQYGIQIDAGFYDRIIGIDMDDMLTIPIRIGFAGGKSKVQAIAGALNGGLINIIVTDSTTATDIIGQS